MPVVLGCLKGRARSGHLLRPLRQIAALGLATGSKICPRWVVSEHNIADKPSRSVDAWHSAGLERWWADFDPNSLDDPKPSRDRGCRNDFKKVDQATSGCFKQHGSPRHDLPRIPECEASNSQRLPVADEQISELVLPISPPPGLASSGGLGSCGVPAGPVQQGAWERRRHQDTCCSEILHASPRETFKRLTSSHSASSEGVESCRSWPAEITFADRSAGGDHGSSMQSQSASASIAPLSPVRHIHASRGMLKPVGETAGAPSVNNGGTVRSVCHPFAPSGRSDAWEDWRVRRVSGCGQRSLAQSDSASTCGISQSRRATVGASSRNLGRRVRCRPGISEVRTSQQLPLHPQTWRCHSRHHDTKTFDVGSQTARQVGVRSVAEKICKASPIADRTFKGPSRNTGVWPTNSKRIANHPQFKIDPSQLGWNHRITKRMQRKQREAQAQSRKPRGNVTPPFDGASLLKSAFRVAVKSCRHKSRKVFLDLFCGDAGVSKQLRALGFGVVSVDVVIDSSFDLCDPKVIAVIEGWIRSGCIHGVWLATPCTTWSRARHGPIGSSWGPLRTNQSLFGVSGLNPHDVAKVKLGNKTMSVSARIIKLCNRCMVPCCLENPAGSMIWLAPPINRCCGLGSSRSLITDFCQHGAKWRKRTRIQTWHCQPSHELSQCCHGRNGYCSLHDRKHIVLKGRDPSSGQLWTQLAQPYPRQFCRAAAKLLAISTEANHSYHLSKRFGC